MFSSYSKQLAALAAISGVLVCSSVHYCLQSEKTGAAFNEEALAVSQQTLLEVVHQDLNCSLVDESEKEAIISAFIEKVQKSQSLKEAQRAKKDSSNKTVNNTTNNGANKVANEAAKESTQNASQTARESIQVAQAENVPQKAASTPTVSRGESTRSIIVRNALNLIGIPYVFGGMSLNGFDCSGFTKYVYAGAGITIPRSSYQQYSSGTPISRDQLQPGDLVFFSTYDSGASHVGIYIGDGSFVHASSTGIKITSLSDSYYAPKYLGARRYF